MNNGGEHLWERYNALTRALCAQRHSLPPSYLNQSRWDAGTIAPAQAHVSITANLIVCQCVSLKSTPICFYLNISGERHTSESEQVWYHVRFGNAVSIHVCEFLKWIVRMSFAAGCDVWSACIIDPLHFHDSARQMKMKQF